METSAGASPYRFSFPSRGSALVHIMDRTEMKTSNKSQLVVLVAIFLIVPAFFAVPAQAADARVYFSAVSPSKRVRS